MTPFRTALSLICCLVLPLQLWAEGPAPAVDRYGDPLPKHVRLRLGTIRFRQGSPVASLRFAPNGKTLRMWDPKTGKEHSSFGAPEMKTSPYQGGTWVLSPDGKVLATFDNFQ